MPSARKHEQIRWSSEPGQKFERFILYFLAVEQNIPVGQLHRHARFVDDLGMDEHDLCELMLAVDDEFGFDRHDEAADAAIAETVDGLVAYCIANYRLNTQARAA